MSRKSIQFTLKAKILASVFILMIATVIAYSVRISDVRLPSGKKPTLLYRDGGFGNGDGVLAWKGPCEIDSYKKFVLTEKLEKLDEPTTLLLGGKISKHDVPDPQWNEPENPELRYYKRFERRFVRCSYDKGQIFYYERSW
jgi:hypothetical protein